MSKVDEYTGNGMIVVSDGEVWAVDDSGLPDVIGEIGRVELSIEMPENLIGIYRVEHIGSISLAVSYLIEIGALWFWLLRKIKQREKQHMEQ